MFSRYNWFALLILSSLAACAADPRATGSTSDDGDRQAPAESAPAGDTSADAPAASPACQSGQCLSIVDGRCGNGACDGQYEDCLTCPVDCGVCVPETPLGTFPNCNRGEGACGNGICQLYACEDAYWCPQDCPPDRCGNGLCDGQFEDCLTCPVDCGVCTIPIGPQNCNDRVGRGACGNGVCQIHACEGPSDCPQDCAPECGDGYCTHAETHETCASDCPAPRTCDNGGLRCGDGTCNCTEDWTNCGDCAVGFCDHNGRCNAVLGESTANCPDCNL